MKAFVILFNLSLSLFAVMGQTTTIEPTGVKLTANNVELPSVVRSRFASDYPNVNPQWSEQEDVYTAEYRVDNTNMGRVVRYDNNGNLLSIEDELNNDDYPIVIGKYYVKKYPHEKYVIWSYRDGKGNKKYCAKRQEGIVWFDLQGNYIPEKSNSEKTPQTKQKTANKGIAG